jgi:hypothetical protein
VPTYVEIVSYDDEQVIRRFGPHSSFKADQIEDGININIDHERFYTRQVDE